jgi:hypothetical protein
MSIIESVSVEQASAPVLRGPLDFPDSPLSNAVRQPMMLGLFLNLQDITFSNLPTTSTWTYDYNAALVRKADAAGFELAFTASSAATAAGRSYKGGGVARGGPPTPHFR